MRRSILPSVLVALLLLMAAPVLAGGWATVRLDEPPSGVQAGVPWRFGFLVKQHDTTPTNDVEPKLLARHKETGEEVTADGRQEGAVGHFEIEVIFPKAGEWKWSIAPEPFAATSFDTLTVLPAGGAAAAPPVETGASAAIRAGTCAGLGDVAFPLGETTMADAPAPDAVPVTTLAATVDAPLAELTSGKRVIVYDQGPSGPLLCGAIAGRVDGDELAVGLRPAQDVTEAGVAVLRGAGDRTDVRLYVVAFGVPDRSPATASEPGATVEIVDGGPGGMSFDPPSLTIPAGATVTWVNHSAIAHTVTGDDLAFDDSSVLDPGATFSQTFAKPGRYAYHCGPHPGMAGEVVVV